jgi:small subunit ribosomal protein S20
LSNLEEEFILVSLTTLWRFLAEEKKDAKKEKKQKRPSALKRNLQSEKRRASNRSYRAKVLTAVRGFQEALEKKEDAAKLKTKFDAISSLMDKGVKRGIYTQNKASRTKSRLATRC